MSSARRYPRYRVSFLLPICISGPTNFEKCQYSNKT